MKKFCSLFLLFIPIAVLAQTKVSPHSKPVFQKVPNGFISELPVAPPQTVGSYFYSESWQTATLYLLGNNAKLEDVPVRLNLKDNYFEIQHNQSVKVLQGSKVQSFEWTLTDGSTETFVNAQQYRLQGTPSTGFFKILKDGTYQLIELTTTEILQANYNVALDVGNKDHLITKHAKLFLAKEHQLLEVNTNKKKLIKEFEEVFQKDISVYVDQYRINPKQLQDVYLLVTHLNKDANQQSNE